MELAVELSDVVKTFGRARALDGLDLQVRTGEVHGFLGPNGAGKSTTMRVLLGLIRVDSGRARLLGSDPWQDPAALHRRVAYVPGDVTLWPTLTGGEVIDLLGRLRGGLDRRRLEQLLECFELDPTKRTRTYSKGNRQKVALVAALAGRADLYLLDEPTSGLDPLKEAEFQRCVREAAADGATVLLSSHVLAEAEALSDRVSIIRAGRLVRSGSLAELRQLTRTTVSAQVTAPPGALADVDGVHHLRTDGDRVTLDVDPDHLDGVLAALSALGVRSLVAHPPTLEELFLRQYADTDTDTPGAPDDRPPGPS
ncbi:ABC transporter ATP-binding protein [Janibacter melonis]|uniref:ABC transporter ATP-binding protein n=1 Tax=Janibacter melonis TaxID=262209 RepID=UPI001919978A|nr:ABC transporter ATP-binding protein [Janibacter melonis]